jgi:thiol-disulfide isomerase/thioredoxin
MKNRILLFLIVVFQTQGQTITGSLNHIKNTEIALKGYDGFEEKALGTTTTDSLGNFSIHYPKNYSGAALLQPKGANGLIVLLNNQNFQMQWDNIQDFKTLHFTNSPDNEAFAISIDISQEAEQKLAGLKYLLPQYTIPSNEYKWLAQEITSQENRFPAFIKTLPATSYAPYYLQLRKLIMDMPLTANRYIERLPQHEKDFATINFNDDRLWTSGLLRELLDGFYQLMESHIDIEKVTEHCNRATDVWLKCLVNNPTRLQTVAEHCFKRLEQRSLFQAAEYLAKAMLNQPHCELTEKNINLFEQYRKMGIGNTAPNISLENNQDRAKNKDLKNINSNYKLVVFGASWCPSCQTDFPKWKENYAALKEKYDLEIVYISIDTDKSAFDEYYKEAPFITFCDYKGWETQAAKAYYVFATPTYFLLDKNLKIVAKLNSPNHLQAWLESKQTSVTD